MADLTDAQLLEIIDGGRSDRVEFEESLSGTAPVAIRETICAFANDLPDHKQPGYVFVGVKNDKKIVGLPTSDDLLQQLIDMKSDGNIVPTPSLTVGKYVLEGKEVAVVKVRPSDSLPVRYKGSIHVRTGPINNFATEQDISILNKKRPYGYIPFDIHPIPGSSIADLDLNLFEQYLSQLYSKNKLNSDNRSIKDKLVATRMIFATDNPLATVLGILVIGKCPQDYMSNAYIKFLKINGCNESDAIVDETNIQGTILDMLNRIDEKLRTYNCASSPSPEPKEKQKGIYPLLALQEIVRNAVMHREYENTKEPVKVCWFNDRVEIINPGGPYGIISSEDFGKTSLTDYRNPYLARAMEAMGFVKHYGFGIPISNNMLKEASHPELKYTVNQHKVMVTIKLAESSL